MPFFSTVYIKTYAFLNLLFTRLLAKTCILMLCLNLFIHAQKSGGELNLVFTQSWCGCLCACASDACAENFSHSMQLLHQQSRASYMLALCLRAVLISSPGTWDWTRMHALVVMHRRTLYENVDSAKIKVLFYTTDIDILRMTLMHRIVIHCIDISIHIDESLHP